MKSSYKRLGDYVREINTRNADLSVKDLLGINIDKFFMPSVANIIGTDLSNYKIVKKNQFACNRMHVGRDERIPIAISRFETPIMVSPAYDVFEIIDPEFLNPEYLMMWFSRKEFDRNAWFYTDADVRGGLPWDALMNMRLPIPSPKIQREIVAEYQVVQNRMALNKQLIQKLEETAQALYKQWFVDFEFPNVQGQPYKSSGGEMVESELGEIPKGWEVDAFTNVLQICGGGTPSTECPEYWNGNVPFYTPADLNKTYYSISTEKFITEMGLRKCSSKLYPRNTIFVTARGATVGGVGFAGIPMAMNQTCYALCPKDKGPFFGHQLTIQTMIKLKTEAIGATFEALVTKDFDQFLVVNPSGNVASRFEKLVAPIYEAILVKTFEIETSDKLASLLLSKLATVEEP